ncbi:MAG: GIY-YIG nuclease family protein, partial [Candidatus Shapirobacteria bacterium]|nr:GIY-YIG nuclease family protein [Candidatus Shapirobacteria bacterium]
MFYVYGIYNQCHNKIYIGQTMDLDVRIKEHNDPENSKHTYTKRFGLGWQLIYSEICQTRKQALIREKQLKSYQGRQFIKTH